MEKEPKEVEDHRGPKEPLALREQLEPKGKEDHKVILVRKEPQELKGHKVTEDHKELREQLELKGQ